MADKNQTHVEFKSYGKLIGHNGMVTSIVIGVSADDDKKKYVISGSRDKKLILWKILPDAEENEDGVYGEAYISLTGHNHFVSDLSLNQDCNYVLSSSWDKSMRLWSLKTGKCT